MMAWWVLAACGSSSDCFREDVFCAALVTDTLGIDDHGINQDAWAGLQKGQTSGLADEVEYIASVDARDYSKNIAYFAERGYDMIFTSGISLNDETLQNADLYPGSVFVGLGQSFEESRENLVSVTFPEDQMGFAAGAAAAKLTRTGIVAAVCEASGIDWIWRYCEGFRAGVKFTDDKVKAQVVYRDSGDEEKLFVDEAWGYETGSGLIENGADVVFAAGGVTGQGALRAASEFGVYAVGSERDQAAALGPGSSVVTSLYGWTSFEVQEVMRLKQEGTVSGARVGRIQFVPPSPIFPPSAVSELELLINMLAKGEIVTKVAMEKP